MRGRNILEDDIGTRTVGSKIEFKVCVFHSVRVHLAVKGKINREEKTVIDDLWVTRL